MIDRSCDDIASKIAGCGWRRLMTAVRASGVSTEVDGREHRLEGVVFLHRLDREGDVLGGDRLAVVEGRALHQRHRDRQAVLGRLPAFGEIGLRLAVLVVAQERREELRARLARRDAGLHSRIEVPRRVFHDLHERAASLRLLLRKEPGTKQHHRSRHRGRNKQFPAGNR